MWQRRLTFIPAQLGPCLEKLPSTRHYLSELTQNLSTSNGAGSNGPKNAGSERAKLARSQLCGIKLPTTGAATRGCARFKLTSFTKSQQHSIYWGHQIYVFSEYTKK